ncbi:MAG TPA: aromatic-ring-hydroxylating dioxygenase subunit beta [Acidimicrobiia bacterium]
MTPTTPVDAGLLREVEQFIYREARLADEGQYDAWEALWTDDAVYWVPANGDDTDPAMQMSIIYDNRSRIATRIKQLRTGKRHAQAPASRLRRIISNVELLDPDDGAAGDPGAQGVPHDDVLAGANFVIYESRERGVTLWAGRSEYRLRPTAEGWRMAAKKVVLVDNDRALSTLAFLV